MVPTGVASGGDLLAHTRLRREGIAAGTRVGLRPGRLEAAERLVGVPGALRRALVARAAVWSGCEGPLGSLDTKGLVEGVGGPR